MSREQDAEYQPRAKVVEHPPHNPSEGFDRRVLISDAKTGQIIRKQPHNLHIVSGQEYYEPINGTGNLFFRSGEHAGRWMKDENGKYGINPTAPHVEPAPTVTLDQAAGLHSALSQENEALKQELAALRAEKEAKIAPKAEVAPAPVAQAEEAPKKTAIAYK